MVWCFPNDVFTENNPLYNCENKQLISSYVLGGDADGGYHKPSLPVMDVSVVGYVTWVGDYVREIFYLSF